MAVTEPIRKLIIYTDGAARGNPGPAGIGVVISDGKGQVLAEFGEGIGETTNNIAEYTALIRALEEAAEFGAAEVHLFLDSELVVKQIKGEYRVKNSGLKGLHAAAIEHIRRYEKACITHIAREKNAVADRLANEALDRIKAGDEDPPRSDAARGQGQLF
jgi:ribonuclease HI